MKELTFSPGGMTKAAGWVLLCVATPLMVVACVAGGRPGDMTKWALPVVFAATAFAMIVSRSEYAFDTERRVVRRRVGVGPLLWGWELPFSKVHAVELGGFTSRYGTSYTTLTLLFGTPVRRRRILLEDDGQGAVDRAHQLSAALSVPVLVAD